MAKRLMAAPKSPKREVKYLAMTRILSKMDAFKNLSSRSRDNCGSSLEKMPKVCVFSFIGFSSLRDAVSDSILRSYETEEYESRRLFWPVGTVLSFLVILS